MKQSIRDAIMTLTQHTRKSTCYGVHDATPSMTIPDTGDPAPRRAAVQTICDRIEALAERTDSRSPDFDALLEEAKAQHADILQAHGDAVRFAFMAAGRA